MTGIEDATQTWPQHAVGTYRFNGETGDALLLHESPPDQEAVLLVLLGDFICLEAGKVIEAQRHEFEPTATQADL